jgi:hypothetical protein
MEKAQIAEAMRLENKRIRLSWEDRHLSAAEHADLERLWEAMMIDARDRGEVTDAELHEIEYEVEQRFHANGEQYLPESVN